MKTSFIFVFKKRLLDQDQWIHLSHTSSEDVFKTSWSRPIYKSSSYVFKTSWRCLAKTSARRFRKLLQNVLQKRLQDIFKNSSRCLAKTSCLQRVSKTSCKNVFKTCSRCLQDVFKTYHPDKLFLLKSLQDVFSTFLRPTAKRINYRRICLGHNSEKLIVSLQNLQ